MKTQPTTAVEAPARSRAFLYCRKSSESTEAQKLSLPAQEREMRSRAQALGITIVETFVESMSARAPGRPEFGRMMERVNAGEVDTLLCWQADRLSRNARDGGDVTFALENGRLQRVVTFDQVLTNEPMSRMFLAMQFGMNRIASDDLIEKTQRGVREKILRGESPGNLPWGYYHERVTKKRSVVSPDPDTWRYVRQLWNLYLTGRYSLADLHEVTRSFPTQSRYRHTRKGDPWSISVLNKMLRNPFYYGEFPWGGELHPGTHKPMVTRVEWERVQRILDKRRTSAPHPHEKRFALSGAIRCGTCGHVYTVYERRKGGRRYVYLKCSRRGCPEPPISEPLVFAQLPPLLRAVALTEAERDACIAMLHERNDLDTATDREAAAEAEHAITRLRAAQATLVTKLSEGVITDEQFTATLVRLQEQEAAMAAVKGANDRERLLWIELAEAFVRALPDAVAAFEAAADLEKGAVLRELLIEPVVCARKLQLKAETPACIIAQRGGRPNWQAIVERLRTAFSQSSSPA